MHSWPGAAAGRCRRVTLVALQTCGQELFVSGATKPGQFARTVGHRSGLAARLTPALGRLQLLAALVGGGLPCGGRRQTRAVLACPVLGDGLGGRELFDTQQQGRALLAKDRGQLDAGDG